MKREITRNSRNAKEEALAKMTKKKKKIIDELTINFD